MLIFAEVLGLYGTRYGRGPVRTLTTLTGLIVALIMNTQSASMKVVSSSC